MFNQLKKIRLPTRCYLCGDKTRSSAQLCAFCFGLLPTLKSACRVCAQPLTQGVDICGACLSAPPAFKRTIAAFHYDWPINHFVTGLKYQHKLYSARLIGNLLADRLCGEKKPDMIIPVPLHVNRLKQRGFNQSLEIARFVAKRLLIPLETTRCVRVKNTQPQTTLTQKQRQLNVRNAFSVGPFLPGERVVILDDVITTGSTVRALAKAIYRAGCSDISVWCCCRK
jgi:ComF family protein